MHRPMRSGFSIVFLLRGRHGWPLLNDCFGFVAGIGGAALGAAGELALDALVGAGLGELVGYANAVEDGVVVRRAVADDADAAYAEQRRATVFGVVEAAAKIVEGAAGEQRADLRGDGAGERFAQYVADEAADAFAGLEGDVAHEAVADDDVGVAVEDVAAFDVADEIDGQSLEQRQSFAGEVVALGFFFADGEQADARLVNLEHAAGVHFAHDGELLEVVRLAIDVGAYVEKHTRIAFGRGHGRGEGGTVDARQRA